MTVWSPQDDGHADLTSHDAFTGGPPHNTFARLRRDDPLHWTPYADGADFWSVTRHADIEAINKQPNLFSSARGIRMEDQSYEEYLARRTFQETDPPEHSRTRALLTRAFAKPTMAAYEEDIRALCAEILDDALEKGTFDATREIARQLPMRMLGRIIGTPDEDLPWLVEKGDALIANTDPDFTDHVLDKLDTDAYRMMPFNSPAGAELYEYARELMETKAKTGDTSGVLHLILEPDKQGDVITETEFRNFFCLLVAAGNDTTRYSIAAGIQAMCHQPELLGRMQAGDVWDTAADEIIRWATPALYFRRTATADTQMHGKTIRAGDKVLVTGSPRPIATRRCSTIPSASTWPASPTGISRSGRAGRMSASACGWRGWRSRCCFRNWRAAFAPSSRPARTGSCARISWAGSSRCRSPSLRLEGEPMKDRLRALFCDHLSVMRGKYLPNGKIGDGSTRFCQSVFGTHYDRDLLNAPGSGTYAGLPDMELIWRHDDIRDSWDRAQRWFWAISSTSTARPCRCVRAGR
jgi:cytochrome P450